MALLETVAYFSLARVQFSTDLYELLSADLVEVRGMDWLNRYFSRDGQLVVTVTSPDAGTTEELSQSLAKHLREQSELVAAIHEEMPLDRMALF